MGNSNPLRDMVVAQKQGKPKGICSICSSNRYVIESAIQQALADDSAVLIESTCNQVNQFGGYSGMKPPDFVEYVHRVARSMALPLDRIILGGDHLGPFPFRNEVSGGAMDKAREMVGQYALSGYTKIHLDTSMRLGDDSGDANTPLDPRIIAKRCANLCAVAEEAYGRLKRENSSAIAPVYVIGTEVPAPGGSDEVEEGLAVTKVSDLRETISVTREAFVRRNLHDAWQRVIAVVVQPGVEFGDHTVVDYDRDKAKALADAIKNFPSLVFEGHPLVFEGHPLVFEGHSTDYQTAKALRELVEDGVAILKVGPALTFAAREAVFMLSYMEEELFRYNPDVTLSRFRDTLDRAMVQNPEYWEGYYRGNEDEVEFARKYSLFDRARYYWADEDAARSLSTLISNLRSIDMPLPLISQFLPHQYTGAREGLLKKDPEAFIRDGVSDVLRAYSYAVGHRGEP